MDIETLAIQFSADGEAQLKEALGGIDGALDGLMRKVMEFVGPAALVLYFKESLTASENLAVSLHTLSLRTGETVEALSRLQFAAKTADAPEGTLNLASRGLAQAMQELSLGAGRGGEALKAMGIETKNADGTTRGFADILTQIAGKFETYKDGMGKSALANDIFLRNGTLMIPMLHEVALGTAAVGGEADKYGATIKAQEEDELLKYHTAMTNLEVVTARYGRALAEGLAPALTILGTALTDSTAKMSVWEAESRAVTKIITFFASAALELAGAFKGIESAAKLAWLALAGGTLTWDEWKRRLHDIADDQEKFNEKIDNAVMKLRLLNNAVAEHKKTAEKPTDHRPDAPTILGAGKEDLDFMKELQLEEATLVAERDKGNASAERLVAINARLLDIRREYAILNGEERKDLKDSVDKITAKGFVLQTMNDAQMTADDQRQAQEREWVRQIQEGNLSLEKRLEFIKKLQETQSGRERLDIIGKPGSMQGVPWATAPDLKGTIDKSTADAAQALVDMEKKLSAIAYDGIGNTFRRALESSFAMAFDGKGIKKAMDSFAQIVLKGIGDVMIRMAETYLTYGNIMAGLSWALSNPFTAAAAAIAIGLALVGLAASLGSIGAGGGGGGPSGAGFNPTHTSVSLSPMSGAAGGVTPRDAVTVNATIIGKDDPQAQRSLLEMISRAQRRGTTSG